MQDANPKTLAVLHKEIMSLSKLVDDLYWLARFDVGRLTDTLVPMDIVVCLQDVLFTFEDRFKDKNITVDTTELAEGLSICKSIIEAHDGTISAMPSVLGGLKIEIKLPLAGGDGHAG